MPGVIRISPADWRAAGHCVRAVIPTPCAARCAVFAEEWADGRSASVRTEGAAPIAFAPLGPIAVAWVTAEAGERIILEAERAPETCHVVFQPVGMRDAMAPFVPRAVRSPGNPMKVDPRILAIECRDALGQPSPDRAIAVLAEMLLTARNAVETQDAARSVFLHAAQRPLWRSTAFGALTAALMDEEVRSSWP